jgi:hypothetical protein
MPCSTPATTTSIGSACRPATIEGLPRTSRPSSGRATAMASAKPNVTRTVLDARTRTAIGIGWRSS